MKIRINPLTVVLFAILAFMGNISLYILTYFIMALHEFAHLVAAIYIGLKPKSITFSPFGVHLCLDNKIINSLADEIILYSAGPLVNAFFALVALYFGWVDIYRLNLILFIMNIMPVMPLDGGMITMRLISYKLGRKRAKEILTAFSVVIGCILLGFFVYSVYIKRINLSVFIIAVFFIGNILTSKEMYNTDLINALSCGKKISNKVKLVVINDTYSVSDAIRELSPAYTIMAVELNEKGEVKQILSEKEILNYIDILSLCYNRDKSRKPC